ncbi:MAG: hypothetical protein ABR518_05450 [Actinomycetota bacterium]
MLAEVPFMLVFRFLHIVSAVLWVGSVFAFVVFVGPSAGQVGPSAGPLLTAIVKQRKYAKVVSGLGATTVLAGWVMWLHNMQVYGSLYRWVTTRFGLVITIGAALATTAWFLGTLGVGRNVERVVTMGGEIAASGAPPTPEQQATMTRLQGLTKRLGRIVLALLVLAATAMATARYW